ncbi:MAG: hypothetical protein R3B84_02650 [Zavarzinella sp.]
MIYLLSDDLIDSSRIRGFGAAQGESITVCKTIGQLSECLKSQPGHLIADLTHPEWDGEQILSQIPENYFLIGFGPHVAAELLRKARQVGCKKVMPRSQFFEELPTRLAEWFQV